jgi:hypothetical protein
MIKALLNGGFGGLHELIVETGAASFEPCCAGTKGELHISVDVNIECICTLKITRGVSYQWNCLAITQCQRWNAHGDCLECTGGIRVTSNIYSWKHGYLWQSSMLSKDYLPSHIADPARRAAAA